MTVRFVSTVADPTLEGRISRYGAEILSKRAYEEAESWLAFAQKPVGTGPYKVVDFKPDNILVLEAHDDYWGVRRRSRRCALPWFRKLPAA